MDSPKALFHARSATNNICNKILRIDRSGSCDGYNVPTETQLRTDGIYCEAPYKV